MNFLKTNWNIHVNIWCFENKNVMVQRRILLLPKASMLVLMRYALRSLCAGFEAVAWINSALGRCIHRTETIHQIWKHSPLLAWWRSILRLDSRLSASALWESLNAALTLLSHSLYCTNAVLIKLFRLDILFCSLVVVTHVLNCSMRSSIFVYIFYSFLH